MSVIGADKTEELDTGSFIDTISDIHAAYLQENGNQTTDLSMKESFSKFLAQGLPGKKDEYWKYTDLGKAISKKSFNLQAFSKYFTVLKEPNLQAIRKPFLSSKAI